MGILKKIGKFISRIDPTGGLITGAIITAVAFAINPAMGLSTAFYIFSASAAVAGTLSSYYQAKELENSLKDLDNGGFLANTRTTSRTLPIVYGEARVGVNWVWIKTTGENNKYLWMVGTLCEGLIEDVEEVYLDGKPLPGIKDVETTSKRVVRSLSSSIEKVKVSVKVWGIWRDDDRSEEWGDERIIEAELTKGSDPQSFNITVSFDFIELPDEVVGQLTLSYTNDNQVIAEVTENPNCTVEIKSVSFKEFYYDNQWYKSPTDLIKWDRVRGYEYSFFGIWNGTNTDRLAYQIHDLGFDENLPYTAAIIVRLTYDRERWQSIPNITVKLRGKVVNRLGLDPNEYDINNPALVLYDYLTNHRYGLGIPSSRIDVESFKEVAKYCKNKGFTFNGVITEGRAEEIIKMILVKIM